MLPYHSMGKVKYDALGISYPLGDLRQLTKEEAKEAYNIVMQACNAKKAESIKRA